MSELLDIISSYVPALVIRHHAREAGPIAAPSAERFPGAVLFADITGSTALAEGLTAHGPAGVEQLSALLNSYFGQLISLINAHGGDIIKFAGDALLALWHATDEDLATATRRAAQCGLAIQKELHNYEALEGVHITMRVGIGAGEVFTIHVGGVYGRWEFLLAGAPVVQMSLAEQQAQPGQVIVSAEAWALIQEYCAGTALRSAAVQLDAVQNPIPLRAAPSREMPPEEETALRSYVPAAMLSPLAAGQAGWIAELRRVTLIFVSLPDLNYQIALERAQAAMHGVQESVYHYEGSINQFGVDDKGASLVAVLGLPPLAHEDDAARGILAALAIHARLNELGIRNSIGITTGRAFCGSIGTAERREYTIVGDIANLAARLMLAAAGDIWCDSATVQAAQARIKFEALPEINVKGKARPVPVFRPTGEIKQIMRPQTALVGRIAERALLAEQLQGLLDGGLGGAVIIEGEAGIGKSRLVDDLADKTRALGIPIFIGAGDAVERTTPYHAWRAVYASLFNLNLDDESSVRRKRVLDQLSELPTDRNSLELAPLLNAVLPLDLPENDTTAPLSGQARADKTRELLLNLLAAIPRQSVGARAPLVLVMEDAHWLDSASWALALEVNAKIQNVLLVVATRPLTEPLPSEYSKLLQIPGIKHLKLDTLSPEETVTLVSQRLGVRALPEPVTALIREKAEGHPFFSEELAYALRDAGLIIITDGKCEIAASAGDLRSINFPDTVQGVITSRIDRLTPSQQLTIKVASVIGRVFAYRILRDIHPVAADKSHLPDYLNSLERFDITRLETPEPELAYIFKHIITQEVAYNLMLFAQRRRLHRAAAEWFERTYADDLSPYYSLLAYHWSKAEDDAKTVEYFEKAGDAAARLYAHAEARVDYTAALDALARLPDNEDNRRRRVDMVIKQVSVSILADGPEKSLERLTEAEAIVKELPGSDGVPGSDRLRMARVQYWQGRSHYLRNELREAVGLYQRVLAVGQEFGDEELIALPSSVIGRVLGVQGQFGKVATLLTHAIPLLEKTGNWVDWIWAVGFLGLSLGGRGQYWEGVAEGERALTRAQAMKYLTGIAASRLLTTATHLMGGLMQRVLDESSLVLEVAEQSGDRLYLYLGHGFQAWAHSRLGNHTASAESRAKRITIAESLGGRLLLADWFAASDAEIALNAGRVSEALEQAEKAAGIAKAVGGIFAEGVAQRVWGQALALANPPRGDEAKDHLAASLQVFNSGENILPAARTQVAWGIVARERGDFAEAREHLEQAAAQFEQSRLDEQLQHARELLASTRAQV